MEENKKCMEKSQSNRINISSPNLVNICIDEIKGEEIGGRLYHFYRKEPEKFNSIIELLRIMENLFDAIGFPQASTKTRCLTDKEVPAALSNNQLPKVVTPEELLRYKGEEGTFITTVRFRQKSTWQGDCYWVEGNEMQRFSDSIGFIRGISR